MHIMKERRTGTTGRRCWRYVIYDADWSQVGRPHRRKIDAQLRVSKVEAEKRGVDGDLWGLMKHACGIERWAPDKPFSRNYFAAGPGSGPDRGWQRLCELGFATLRRKPTPMLPYNCYVVSKRGLLLLKGKDPGPPQQDYWWAAALWSFCCYWGRHPSLGAPSAGMERSRGLGGRRSACWGPF